MREDHIKFLREINRQGSITSASEYLSISPQALSASIQTLEKELGFQVLTRSNQGVSMTKEGLQFLAYANDFYDALRGIRSDVEGSTKKVKHILYATEEGANYFSVPLAKEMIEGHSDYNIDLQLKSANELEESLKQEKIDGFFTIIPAYEGIFFSIQQLSRYDDIFEHIVLAPIARLCCLAPKTAAVYDFKRVSLKTVIDFPSLFLETRFRDNGSIFHQLNQIGTIRDYEFCQSKTEYKVRLLLGNRIGYEFINDYSEWKTYPELLNIIEIKENFSLYLCIVARKDCGVQLFDEYLKNTRFEKKQYQIL
ncbi:MAG: LysR family transcriptional regulator [Peptococcaceae bacterium]|nr:LysR family transcriptional regulator [Peptococcaceae bacterium]